MENIDSLPPQPDKDILEKYGWKLTGECRTPDPEKDEFWFCIPLISDFIPWSSKTGKPSPHPSYGTKRWIIMPVETLENKLKV